MSTRLATTNHNPWIPRFTPNPHARLRLFCLPNAGAGAVAYRTWTHAFSPSIQVVPVQLPGRESRIAEPLHTAWEPMVDGLLTGLRPFLDAPFALFGHSMGALLSFELTRALRRHGLPQPKVLFASSFQAPQLPRTRPDIHALSEADFRDALRRYNGTPQAVLEHPELMDLFGPILRADFQLCETYEYRPEAPLDLPITAFAGDSDAEAPPIVLEPWREQTSRFALHVLPGDHFYLVPQRAALVELLERELSPLVR